MNSVTLAFQAIVRMPRRTISTFACLFILTALRRLAPNPGGKSFFVTAAHRAGQAATPSLNAQFLQDLFVWIAAVAGAVAIASFAVAVHRWVLLNDINDSWLLLRNRHDIRFAAWLAAVKSLFVCIAVADTILSAWPGFLSGMFAIAVPVAVVIVVSRLAILFPAIATDRRDAFSASIGLTRRHTMRIILTSLGLFVVVALAVATLFMPARAAIRAAAGAGLFMIEPAATIGFVTCLAVAQVLLVATFASMASIFLQIFSGEGRPKPQVDKRARQAPAPTEASAA